MVPKRPIMDRVEIIITNTEISFKGIDREDTSDLTHILEVETYMLDLQDIFMVHHIKA